LTHFAATVALAIMAGIGLTGCAATVNLEPADGSDDPACAEVSVRLPGAIGDQPRRWTDAQATGAWGDPATILLTCGVTAPGPTTMRCETVAGVDWIIDETDAPRFRVTTYGRTPAVEIYLDTEVGDDGAGVSSRDVLDAISPIVATLPVDGQCVGREDATPVP
jgi:hypothetical protein